ncbi:hypothetical protein BVG81_006185, partial [Haliangium sp. UPWRP_2]
MEGTLTTKTTQKTRTTFVKRCAMRMGGLALLAAAPLSGCGTGLETENFGSLSRAVEERGDTLNVGDTLTADQQLVSANRKYRAIMQNDGNFVVYGPSDSVVWAANQYILGAITGWSLKLESSGNLTVRDTSGGLKWASGSYLRDTSQGAFLKLDNFGGLTLYAGTTSSPGEKRWFSKLARYAEVAKKWRPVFNIHQDQLCEPLDFKEEDSGNGTHWRYCRYDYTSSFAVFASVQDHPDDRPNSYRITYAVAFGWQSGTPGLPNSIPTPGSHGYDAQYLVVDVVDDRLISVWADMHKGHYARTARGGRGLTLYNNDTQVTAWVGKYYN